jgi:hypothetical protein
MFLQNTSTMTETLPLNNIPWPGMSCFWRRCGLQATMEMSSWPFPNIIARRLQRPRFASSFAQILLSTIIGAIVAYTSVLPFSPTDTHGDSSPKAAMKADPVDISMSSWAKLGLGPLLVDPSTSSNSKCTPINYSVDDTSSQQTPGDDDSWYNLSMSTGLDESIHKKTIVPAAAMEKNRVKSIRRHKSNVELGSTSLSSKPRDKRVRRGSRLRSELTSTAAQ